MRHLNKEVWPYQIATTSSNTLSMERWLSNNLGKFRDQWNAVYLYGKTIYYFKKIEDAVWFEMKWN